MQIARERQAMSDEQRQEIIDALHNAGFEDMDITVIVAILNDALGDQP
jgi:hypothetical protein